MVPYFNCNNCTRRFFSALEHLRHLKDFPDIWVVECRLTGEGNLPFLPRQPSLSEVQPHNVIETESECRVWHKENIVNIAFRHLIEVEGYTKVAWTDADVFFLTEGWHEAWEKALDHHKLVQPFEKVARRYSCGETFESVSCIIHGRARSSRLWTQGIAWGFRADALQEAGYPYFYPYGFGGSGDDHFIKTVFKYNVPTWLNARGWKDRIQRALTIDDCDYIAGHYVETTREFAEWKTRRYTLWERALIDTDLGSYCEHTSDGSLKWRPGTPENIKGLAAARFAIYDRREKTDYLPRTVERWTPTS